MFKDFFAWLRRDGALTVSQKLLVEYGRSRKDLIFVLINELNRAGRYNKISNNEIKTFTLDRHYSYRCQSRDIPHARLVFLSFRKRLVAFDNKLVEAVNGFKRVNGIQPIACKRPDRSFYE